jgi:hypothetical protein
MQRWFLSYHSPDQALAERLRAENFISAPARQFACRLLAYNQTMIRELAGG